MKMLNRYIVFARYIPALITLIPLLLIYFFLSRRYTDYSLGDFLNMTFILGLSMTFIFTFFAAMIIRELGTHLEKKYFRNKLGFPTSYFMLYANDHFPEQIKDKFGEYIQRDFGLTRLPKESEINNQVEAMKVLNQATRFLSMKYQGDAQVKEANISYGFSRNVSGGLFISIPASISGIILGCFTANKSLIFWCSIAAIIFILVCIFHKKWIINNAEKYADKILSTYLG